MLFRSDRLAQGDTQSGAPEASRLLGRAVTADIAPDDRARLSQLVALRTGISQEDAQKRVDTVITQAKAAADTARKAAATLALWMAAALLAGALSAGLAAVEGGRERDGRHVCNRPLGLVPGGCVRAFGAGGEPQQGYLCHRQDVSDEPPMPTHDDKTSPDLPWFRRFRPDGRMEPHATRGDNGEILILDYGWAASFKDGRWHQGIQFFHEQIAEFSPVQDQAEIYRLVEEAHKALGASSA